MKKIILFLLTLMFIFIEQSFSYYGEMPQIITRDIWGAHPNYNNKESSEWKTILERRSQSISKPINKEQAKKNRENQEKIHNYLNTNFASQFTTTQKKYYNHNGGHSYAWPLEYTNFIDSIVIHHTHSEYKNSEEGIRKIHNFHSLSKEWGDIGYNYIIGYDGEIFEGREGGEYVSAAHSKYNNFGSIGIALMGNYDSHGINEKQYMSLKKLVSYLTVKYGIDLSKKRYYHMNCAGKKCNTFPIETYQDSVLVGHRDTGHTSCPGEKLYNQIHELKNELLPYTIGLKSILRNGSHNINLRNYNLRVTKRFEDYKKLLSGLKNSELRNIYFKIFRFEKTRNISGEQKYIIQTLKYAIQENIKKHNNATGKTF